MDTSQLPRDFKEFLKLLNSNGVEYLLIGGYAVGYHGYPRPTGDLDVWINSTPEKLKENKRASGRFKDQMDLENLP